MNRTIAMVATSAALVGCGAGIRSVDEASAATTTIVSASDPTGPTQPAAPANVVMPGASNDPACLAGTWEMDADSLLGDGDLDGVTLTIGDGQWSLATDDGTYEGVVDGAIVDAVLTGAASGSYTIEGDVVTFTIDSADGTAESSLESVEFADVITATLPPDQFHVACEDDGAQLVSDSTAIVLSNTEPDGSVVTVPATGDCLVGEWNLDGLGVDLVDATITGVTISFDGSAWRWTATDATVSGTLAGAEIEGAFDGTATGAYEWDGDTISVTTESGDGTVSAEFGADATFAGLLQTLVPSPTLTVVCDDEAAALTAGPSVLSLTRLSAPAESLPPASEAASVPVSSGEVLVIDIAGDIADYDCGGRVVEINASAVMVDLTGDCPTVTINGTSNDVAIERVDVINVNGINNDVTWESGITAAEPTVNSDGLGNAVDQA